MQCSSFETRLNVPAATAFFITDIQLINSNTDVQLTISGLTVGQDYQIQDSVNLPDGFINVGSPFAATDASAQVEVVPVNLNTEPDRFFQVIGHRCAINPQSLQPSLSVKGRYSETAHTERFTNRIAACAPIVRGACYI
jgi:hypothetical protein